MSKVLVVIGDIRRSRDIQDRESFQKGFEQAIEWVCRNGCTTLSPYTITLGDEFQSVLNQASHIFRDLINILSSLKPHDLRFALSIDTISTPINEKQAIGMDGPAFRAAREAIEYLKAETQLFTVTGLPEDVSDLSNDSLALISKLMEGWQPTRFKVLAHLYQGRNAADIASNLNISKQAVYKNIKDGSLKLIMKTFADIEAIINHELRKT